MLKSHPIIAFVATTAPARAKNFYANTLGLRLISEDAFALVFDAGGTMLRVAIVQQLQPAGYTVLGWIVSNIRRAVRNLAHRGMTFRRYEGLEQDDQGIWAAPSGASIAWFEDPDGNTLSLTEFERPNRRLKRPRPRPSKTSRRGVRLRRGRYAAQMTHIDGGEALVEVSRSPDKELSHVQKKVGVLVLRQT